MAYVDLKPVRAGLAERIEACRETSIAERLRENSAEELEAYLAPLVSGLEAVDAARADPRQRSSVGAPASTGVAAAEVPAVQNRPLPYPSISQRAYGPKGRLADWIGQRGLQLRETPLPA